MCRRLYWAKDWAKLLMNATLLAADCLPRGGVVTVETGADPQAPSFHIRAEGLNARVTEDVDRALQGRGAECGRPRRPALPDPQAVAHRQCRR